MIGSIHTSHKSAFTLIEILIVIMIMGMMLTATYAPYSHYQKKALLKQAVKEISQSLYEARNLAINGLDVGGKNVSVGIYFDTSDTQNKKLTYFSYPHNDNINTLVLPSTLPDTRVIKTKDLPNSIQIDKIAGGNDFIFFYSAITGSGSYRSWDGGILTPEIPIEISYKGANTPTLQSTIKYYTDTYIADY